MADEVFIVQYTSGATGISKPVLVTTSAEAHNVRAAHTAYDLHLSSVILPWLIISGATCVLASPNAFMLRP